MLWAAEKLIISLGYVRAELEVERTNQRALRFYESLGWTMFKNRPVSGVNLRLAKYLQPKNAQAGSRCTDPTWRQVTPGQER